MSDKRIIPQSVRELAQACATKNQEDWIIYWDDDYRVHRSASYSWWLSPEGQAFVEERDVLAIVEPGLRDGEPYAVECAPCTDGACVCGQCPPRSRSA